MTNKRFDNYLHPLSVTPALTAHPALASYSNPVKPKSLVSITDIKPQIYIQQIVKSEVRTVICFMFHLQVNSMVTFIIFKIVDQ